MSSPCGLGPLFPAFPPGLVLDLKLQGDVVREAVVRPGPWAGQGTAFGRHTDSGNPFHSALAAPIGVARLEVARAVHHLR